MHTAKKARPVTTLLFSSLVSSLTTWRAYPPRCGAGRLTPVPPIWPLGGISEVVFEVEVVWRGGLKSVGVWNGNTGVVIEVMGMFAWKALANWSFDGSGLAESNSDVQ